jgi:hypothetical protein
MPVEAESETETGHIYVTTCKIMESAVFYEHRGRCPPYDLVHSQPLDRYCRTEIESRHF